MTTQLSFGKDVQGQNAYSPTFSDTNFQVPLYAGTAKSFTIPSNYQVWTVVFSPQNGCDIWVANNHTAEIPVSPDFIETFSQLNPASRTVYAGDVISCITGNTSCELGVALYAISQ